jgi:hypothetical protein
MKTRWELHEHCLSAKHHSQLKMVLQLHGCCSPVFSGALAANFGRLPIFHSFAKIIAVILILRLFQPQYCDRACELGFGIASADSWQVSGLAP